MSDVITLERDDTLGEIKIPLPRTSIFREHGLRYGFGAVADTEDQRGEIYSTWEHIEDAKGASVYSTATNTVGKDLRPNSRLLVEEPFNIALLLHRALKNPVDLKRKFENAAHFRPHTKEDVLSALDRGNQSGLTRFALTEDLLREVRCRARVLFLLPHVIEDIIEETQSTRNIYARVLHARKIFEEPSDEINRTRDTVDSEYPVEVTRV